MPCPPSSDHHPPEKKRRASRATRKKSPAGAAQPSAQKKSTPREKSPRASKSPTKKPRTASRLTPKKKAIARKPRPKKKSARKNSAQNPAPLNPRALSRLDLVAVIAATHITSLSSSTVGNWIASGCPRNADGSFDIVAVAAWLALERRNRAATTAKQSKALERYRESRASLTELQLRIRTGELVESHVVTDQCREIGLQLRNAFASIERRHGRVVGDEIRSALDSAFRKMKIVETSQTH